MILTPETQKLPIGELLRQAGLISTTQLELALQNQKLRGYEELRLGEILDLRGWVKQETTDFFASCWNQLIESAQIGSFKQKIGDYFYDAHLLNTDQIADILRQQRATKMLFGQLAVARGYVKQETLDFFVQNLFPVSQKDLQVEFHLQRAKIYVSKQEFQNAVIELRQALQLAPKHYKCHAWLAKTYLFQNQVSLAKIHLKKAMEANADDVFVRELYKTITSAEISAPKKTKAKSRQDQKGFLSWFGVS